MFEYVKCLCGDTRPENVLVDFTLNESVPLGIFFEDGGTVVIGLVPGAWAEEKQIKIGDIINKVNGEEFAKLDMTRKIATLKKRPLKIQMKRKVMRMVNMMCDEQDEGAAALGSNKYEIEYIINHTQNRIDGFNMGKMGSNKNPRLELDSGDV